MRHPNGHSGARSKARQSYRRWVRRKRRQPMRQLVRVFGAASIAELCGFVGEAVREDGDAARGLE